MKPTFKIICGGICSGKTTFRKNEYSKQFIQIDAGEIFIDLSNGAYYDFPSHLEEEMNNIGIAKLSLAVKEKKNIVMEVVGSDLKLMEEINQLVSGLHYQVEIKYLTCSVETAAERNENRDDDNISSWFYEQIHLKWLKQVNTELK